jgi:tripartite-type tricarboxylate transporter receptor subunit TctC
MSLAAGSAVAQAYPSRPIRLVVPWPAGGANDILGRVLASSLMKTVGQSVVVDNRGGANGMMGADVVAKAAPDGYTLMFHSITSQVTNPAFYKKLPYDSINDFVPITQVAAIPLVIVVHPSFPAHSVDELIKLARSQPGKINYASFGNASISHLAGELFNKMGDVNLTHVPYKGAAPALNDTLSGQVPLYFASVAPTIPLIQAGKLRAVAVTGAQRSKQLPEVPTVAESPQFRGYEAVGMFAVWAPKGTPADIVAMLNRSLRTSMASAEFKESLDKLGAIGPLGNSPEDMAKTIRSDMEKLTNLVKSSGIQAD